MKIGLIGLGNVAKHQIAALATLSEFEVTDAFDANAAAAQLLPPSAHFHRSLDEMLANATADIFIVSTPNVTHLEIASRVIEARKPVVIEKPICANSHELETLAESARARPALLYVALHAAFARDLQWWIENRSAFNLGQLIGFEASFFDPYIVDGQLTPGASSFGGPWFDSGINALSVITKLVDANQLLIEEFRMTRVPQIPCQEIQALAILSFPGTPYRRRGIIDTNWTLGLNCKVTRLSYDAGEVMLDHTNERVIVTQGSDIVREVDCRNDRPRLTNHYIEVFRDLHQRIKKGQSNFREAEPLHQLLFSASRMAKT